MKDSVNRLILLFIVLFVNELMFSQNIIGNDKNQNEIQMIDLKNYFDGFKGCFVLLNDNENSYVIYNQEKSITRISPCSTFKVIHSLIGLETNVVKDERTVFSWNGEKYPIDAWNQDLNMADAIKLSAFWYFQSIAKQVGSKRMKEFLQAIHYGNEDITGGLTVFWQQSSLKISPKEQVELLRRIWKNQTIFKKRNVDILKRILKQEEKSSSTLYGKTGSGMLKDGFQFIPGNENVNGWYIGIVEIKDNVYYFATNIEAESGATGIRARQITLNILRYLNIY